MFVVCHRKQILTVALCVLVALAFVPIAVLGTARAAADPVCIGIDPGHGGYDAGVKGIRSDVRECDINLSIATYLGTYLRNAGYRVVYTRTRDRSPVENAIAATDSIAAGARKVRDMQLRLSAWHNADCVLGVSIHCNYYPSAYRRGLQVFYTKDADLMLATTLQQGLNRALNQPQIGRDLQPLWGDYYLPAHAQCPCAIVECGFLSNADDEQLLCDATYRMTVAYRLCCGIRAYLGETVLDT